MKKSILLLLPLIISLASCGSNDNNFVPHKDETDQTQTQEDGIEDATSSEAGTEEELKAHSLTYNDVPSPVGGNNYPADQEITSESGAKFYISCVMKGGGDYLNHIQMKKGVSYIYTLTPVKGTLTFSVLKQTQFYEGTDHDFTGIPTVYVGSDKDNISTLIEYKEKKENGNYIDYTYESSNHYFKIADESKYALYVASFNWN